MIQTIVPWRLNRARHGIILDLDLGSEQYPRGYMGCSLLVQLQLLWRAPRAFKPAPCSVPEAPA